MGMTGRCEKRDDFVAIRRIRVEQEPDRIEHHPVRHSNRSASWLGGVGLGDGDDRTCGRICVDPWSSADDWGWASVTYVAG
jgi:hypothetical protein